MRSAPTGRTLDKLVPLANGDLILSGCVRFEQIHAERERLR
jgi:hypothetical protein